MGGLLVGTCLPAFRRRIVAGIVVALAVTIAFHTVAGLYQTWNVASSVLMGIFHGIIYSALFWSYEPAETSVRQAKVDE